APSRIFGSGGEDFATLHLWLVSDGVGAALHQHVLAGSGSIRRDHVVYAAHVARRVRCKPPRNADAGTQPTAFAGRSSWSAADADGGGANLRGGIGVFGGAVPSLL